VVTPFSPEVMAGEPRAVYATALRELTTATGQLDDWQKTATQAVTRALPAVRDVLAPMTSSLGLQ
jgi:hypothetical protein